MSGEVDGPRTVHLVTRPVGPAFRLRIPAGLPLTVLSASTHLPELGDESLSRLLNTGGWDHRRPTLFVVNDAQRATPTSRLLSLLDPPLASWSDVRVAVATGSHRAPDETELGAILGPGLLDLLRDRLAVHDARATDLVPAGTTARGTPVAVHPLLLTAASVVAVGSVEPHYFAGYTGGRKGLVPGLAAMETMRANHRLALEDGARALRLAGNPVHEDLDEACRLVLDERRRRGLGGTVAVSTIHLGPRIVHLDRGPLEGAVERVAPLAADLFSRPLPGPFPVVAALPGLPLDDDFYQAMKAFENWRPALAPGGILILAADCPRGLGPDHFRDLLRHPPDVLGSDGPAGGMPLGVHKAANLRRHIGEGKGLYLASPRPFPELEPWGVRWFGDLQEAVTAALAAAGSGAPPALLAVEEAGTLVPRLPGA